MKKFKLPGLTKAVDSSLLPNVNRVKTLTRGVSGDTWLFISVFLLGTLAILFLNVVVDRPNTRDGWDITLRIIPLIILMVAYALIIALTPKFRLEHGQAGDNCYYLGFLFTLVSLVFALYDFVGERDKILVVQDFGIALSTTILGLVLRVMFSQTRIDPDNVEAVARTELTKAAQQMRSQLEGVVVDFNGFRRSIEQSITDMLREQKAVNMQVRDDTLGQHMKVVENWSTTISRASSEFAESTDSLKASTENVERATQKFAESMERDSSRFEEQSASIEHVNEGIAKLREQYSALMNMSEIFSDEFVEKMKVFSVAIGEASTLLEKDGQSLNEAGLAFKEAANELNELNPMLKQLPETLRTTLVVEHAKVAEEWSKNAEKTNAELADRGSSLGSATEAAAGAISSLAERVQLDASGFEEQRKAIDQVNGSIAKLNGQLNALSTLFDNEKIRKLEAFTSEIAQVVSLLEDNKGNLGETGLSVKAILDDLKKLEPLLERFPASIKEIDKQIQDLKRKKNRITRLFSRGN